MNRFSLYITLVKCQKHIDTHDDNNNTPEPSKADPEDDLLDEMK